MSAAKKRSPSKGEGGGQRRGLSGNPQRRAGQLRDKQPGPARAGAVVSPPAAGPAPDPSVMRELAYRMAGGADPAPWWRESHDRVLARARAASWPRRDVEIEDLTCQIVGGELFDCLERSLADGDGSVGWHGLSSLLRGIALTAPRTAASAPDDTRLLFPGIKDSYDTALAEAGEAARLLADRGAAAVAAAPDGGCRPAGAPLVARDEYGSRFLLAAPFRYDGHDGEPADHWYAWDIDTCWIDTVVGAGTFGSAAGALAEWREAVGPRATGAVLAECPPELTARLLAQSLQTGPFPEFMDGGEPRELVREYYRERRRACELAESLGDLTGGAGSFVIDMDKARDEFLRWYAARHGAGLDAVVHRAQRPVRRRRRPRPRGRHVRRVRAHLAHASRCQRRPLPPPRVKTTHNVAGPYGRYLAIGTRNVAGHAGCAASRAKASAVAEPGAAQ